MELVSYITDYILIPIVLLIYYTHTETIRLKEKLLDYGSLKTELKDLERYINRVLQERNNR